jgi:phosphoribosyl 1,2-cyclic phosphate phosphodiesterase
MGMDDLRPLSFATFREDGPVPLYATPKATAVLERVFDYTFSPHATYPNRARVQLHPLEERITVHGVDFLRVPVMHGEMEIVGYRFGRVAYLTDVSAIPESSFALLNGLDHLILSALRHKPHPTHATLEQAVAWAKRIGARHTWFTHICHDLGHEETNRTLPDSIRLAFDGFSLPVNLGAVNS